MRYYPAYLDIKDRACLVVGGGQVGTRKVGALLKCGARVTVISPQVTQELTRLAAKGRIELHRRAYQRTDMAHVFLVIGATNDPSLNKQIHQDAEAAQRLCNIADQPGLCNFVLPAIINQGDLSIAISTGGKSPAFARHLRRQLQALFGPEYGAMLALMGAIRQRLLALEHAPEAHKPLFEQLIQNGLLEMIKNDNVHGINTLLDQVLGPGYVYAELMEKT
jgi:precorrin-2 dehydrogenase / sirohydrochlorin ferrochelatase